MKLLLTTILLFFVSLAFAQYDTSKGEKTETFITIENVKHEVFKTPNGTEFIVLPSSKPGIDYPVWIGKATTKMHEGKPVRETKKGKLFIFAIGKSGNPYCKYIK